MDITFKHIEINCFHPLFLHFLLIFCIVVTDYIINKGKYAITNILIYLMLSIITGYIIFFDIYENGYRIISTTSFFLGISLLHFMFNTFFCIKSLYETEKERINT